MLIILNTWILIHGSWLLSPVSLCMSFLYLRIILMLDSFWLDFKGLISAFTFLCSELGRVFVLQYCSHNLQMLLHLSEPTNHFTFGVTDISFDRMSFAADCYHVAIIFWCIWTTCNAWAGQFLIRKKESSEFWIQTNWMSQIQTEQLMLRGWSGQCLQGHETLLQWSLKFWIIQWRWQSRSQWRPVPTWFPMATGWLKFSQYCTQSCVFIPLSYRLIKLTHVYSIYIAFIDPVNARLSLFIELIEKQAREKKVATNFMNRFSNKSIV